MADRPDMHATAAGSQYPASSRALNYSRVPGDSGRPLIGHTFDFLRRTQGLMDDLRTRHGADFRMQVFGRPVLVVGSPDLVREVLLDREKNFSSERGWYQSIGKLFARGLMLKDYDDHRTDRRIMQLAFRNEAMRGYVATMNEHIHASIANWPRELELYPSLKQLTLDMAARIFLGLTLGPDTRVINRAFVATVAASIAVVRREVPMLAFGRGMRGRRTLEAFFATLIRQRRENPGTDLLSELCSAKTEDGERFSDRAISDHIIFLMMAAHDTTTSSLSSLVHLLLENPLWQEHARDEVRARGASPLTWDDRAGLPVLDRCFDETLRLFPPAPFLARHTLRACTLGSIDVPANTPLAPSPLVTHRLPEFWSAPDRFDPDRFVVDRAEHTAHSHLYYPFGGGAHVCIGLHFARMQVKAVMSELLGRFRLRDPRRFRGTRAFASVPIPFPRDGLPVVLDAL